MNGGHRISIAALLNREAEGHEVSWQMSKCNINVQVQVTLFL